MGKITLVCSQCLSRNYRVSNSAKQERLSLNKFCPKCNKHTLHKETK